MYESGEQRERIEDATKALNDRREGEEMRDGNEKKN
jgi:hypothetical protein